MEIIGGFMQRHKESGVRHTSSYIAQPIMFSATTTGPETEKTAPAAASSVSAPLLEDMVRGTGGEGWMETVDREVEGWRTEESELAEAGETGSGGSWSGPGGDDDGPFSSFPWCSSSSLSSVCAGWRLAIRSSKEGRVFSRRTPKPNMDCQISTRLIGRGQHGRLSDVLDKVTQPC